jgi:hypothetical protein
LADAREIRIEYADQADLAKAWRNYIKHGALVARVYPAPNNGDRVRVVLHPMWEGPDAILAGSVVQASASTTVLQLDPLDAGARSALVALGIEDAAPDLEMEALGPEEPDAPTVDEALVAETRESDVMEAAQLGGLEPERLDVGPGETADSVGPEPEQGGIGPGETAESVGPGPEQPGIGPGETVESLPREPDPAWDPAPLAGKSWAEIADEGPAVGQPDESWAGAQPDGESVGWEVDETLLSNSGMPAAGPDVLAQPALRPIRQGAVSWESMPAVPAEGQQEWAQQQQQQQVGWDQQQEGWDQQQGWEQQHQGWDQQSGYGHPAVTQPPPAPAAPGEPMDVRQIAALSGPAGTDTESILPAIADYGDFGDKNWRDTLLGFFMRGLTGVVVIHAFRENRWCYLVDGRPVHYQVDHSHPGEYLSDALLKDGVVSGRQWTQAMTAAKLTGLAPGEFLVRRGLLSRQQLQAALVSRAAAITRNLIGANYGKWTLHEWTDVRDLFPWEGVDVLGLLLTAERGAKGRLTDEEITKDTEPHLDRHVALVDERRELLPHLDLDGDERILVTDLLPGGWTMKEMMIYGGIREKALLRFIWVLRAMGFVELKRDEGPLSKRNRAERILYVALRDIGRRGDFEALHCHWTAIEDEITEGYQRILKEFGRERFEAVLDPRLKDLIDRIKSRADEALASVRTLAGRTEVRKKIVGEAQLIMAADLMIKQANMEVYKSNFGVARACYERVLELAPRMAETGEQRKHAKAQLANPQIGGARVPGAAAMARVAAAIDDAVREE